MLILTRGEVERLLRDRGADVLRVVEAAYRAHARGRTRAPHSLFLRLPEHGGRVIGAAGYVGGEHPRAGIKWIASFPANVARGLERASAVVVLNDLETGHPEAVIEGAVISAQRTAASAALAACCLHDGSQPGEVGVIGAGRVNAEILRFLSLAWRPVEQVTVYDLDTRRSEGFAERCGASLPTPRVAVAATPEDVLASHALVSIATTATTPHLSTAACRPGATVLHVSLRDLLPESILQAVNVVDDPDHVCRERTSLELAEEMHGSRDFIATTVGDLLDGRGSLQRRGGAPAVFSPFGLGVLDVAVADLVLGEARSTGAGTRIDSFVAEPGVGAS